MNDVLINLGMQIGIPAGIGIICLLTAKFFPKEKSFKIAGIFRKWGRLISKIGNTKLGKKSMNKIEEGPIATVLGFIGKCVSEFSAGLAEDNIKKEVEKKIPKEIEKAFREAMKK